MEGYDWDWPEHVRRTPLHAAPVPRRAACRRARRVPRPVALVLLLCVWAVVVYGLCIN
jgi:hypothetical protein